MVLYTKNAFRFDFGPTGKHALSLACIFRLGHFPRSKIEYESIFLIKYYIISNLHFLKAFWFIFNKVKKGFPIAVLNLARKGSGFF